MTLWKIQCQESPSNGNFGEPLRLTSRPAEARKVQIFGMGWGKYLSWFINYKKRIFWYFWNMNHMIFWNNCNKLLQYSIHHFSKLRRHRSCWCPKVVASVQGSPNCFMGIFSFSGAKKAASTLQSTSCYNLRFAQGWRGSTNIGGIFLRLSKSWKIYLRKLPTFLNLLAEISGRRRIPHRNLASWWNFCGEWVKKTEPFIVVLSLQESNLSSDLVDSATMASPRPFSAAGRFRDTRVIGENFNGGGLWAVCLLKASDGFRWEHDVSWYLGCVW